MSESNEFIKAKFHGDAFSIKIQRILNFYDLNYEGEWYFDSVKKLTLSKFKKVTKHKSFLFGLCKTKITELVKVELGMLKQEGMGGDVLFNVYGDNNLPFAKFLADKISRAIEKSINIYLVKIESEEIKHNFLSPQWLDNRRQFLEREQKRIEDELADVHKKIQAIEGSGPYRALSAVE